MRLLAFVIAVYATIPLPVRWEELNSVDFVTAITNAKETCVLPFGILEKHGPHLPLGSDLINARHASLAGAQREYAVVFPEYYFGQILKPATSPAQSLTARACNSISFRRPPMRWRATAARRF